MRNAGARPGAEGPNLDAGSYGGGFPPGGGSASSMSMTLATGDSLRTQVLPRPPRSSYGSLAEGARRQRIAIPGYTGHVDGKVAENIHGETFNCENERATRGLPQRELRRTMAHSLSAPTLERDPAPRGLSVAPRVPGYTGNVPGIHSETVMGCRFAEASEAAQEMRRNNPHNSSKSWLRSGCWPADTMATYKFATGRLSMLSTQPMFSEAEDAASYESNRRLGLTFGLRPTEKPHYKPGDRFVHHKGRVEQAASNSGVSFSGSAGVHTHDRRLDTRRHKEHNPYVASIRYGF